MVCILVVVWYSISVPARNQRGPQHLEPVLTALHSVCPRRVWVGLSFSSNESGVGLFAELPKSLQRFFAARMADAFPQCLLMETPAPGATPKNWRVVQRELYLTPDVFSLRTHEQFEHGLSRSLTDPVAGILSAIRKDRDEPVRVTATLTLRPARKGRRQRANTIASDVGKLSQRNERQALRYAFLATHSSRAVRLVALAYRLRRRRRDRNPSGAVTTPSKLEGPLFEAKLMLSAAAPPEHLADAQIHLRELAAAFDPLLSPRVHWRSVKFRRRLLRRGFLLSVGEVATLWHPPTEGVQVAELRQAGSSQFEPPLIVPLAKGSPEIAVLGRLHFRARRDQFGLRLDDRRRHLAIVGKTGMGKSTLLLQLIAADIRAGRGVALIDPHGDLADAVLPLIPRERTNDVVLFDAADPLPSIAFNPLHCRQPGLRPLVAAGVLSAFKKMYGDSWGPRMEHIFRNALLAVLEDREASLFSVLRILSDARYRQRLTGTLQDPVVRAFWQEEFARWKPQFQAEAVAPIQNKVGQFLSYPILRAILGGANSTIDLRRIMDDGRVLIVNLSQGRLGEDASRLLGALLVTSLQQAAMSRADMPESDRRDFYCFVDEFQHFATESFATLLSEARKYRFSLVLANQYLAQLDEGTRQAVFGNVGSLLAFQVGAEDAETLAEEFSGEMTPPDLLQLPRYTAYLRLLIDGLPSRPFSIQTLPPLQDGDPRRVEIIRRTSRHRYGRGPWL